MRGPIETALAEGKSDLLLAASIGLLLSLIGFVAFGGALYLGICLVIARIHRGYGDPFSIPFIPYFLIYSLAVFVLMVIGLIYRPKDTYYLGIYSRRSRGIWDNPTTLQDDFDRLHASLGFLLVVPNFIRRNLIILRDVLGSGGKPVDPVLASGILLLARNSDRPGTALQTLSPFGEDALRKGIDTLRALGWVRFHKNTGTLSLGRRGTEVLKRTGRTTDVL
jgi:hypothetical protein